MKFKQLIGLLGISALCVLTLFVGKSHSDEYTGISGSLHDLSLSGASPFRYDTIDGEPNEQVCVFCHTPHGANRNIRETTIFNSAGYTNTPMVVNAGPMLLWNRNLASMPSFTAYQSSTLNITQSEIRAYSLLCLSCHDGVSAMNVLLNYPNGSTGMDGSISGAPNTMAELFNGTMSAGWGPNIGDRVNTGQSLNLSNDHPVSFDYLSSHPDVGTGLNGTGLGSGYAGRPELKLWPSPWTGQKTSFECETCHDVHNQGGPAGEPLYPFLRVSKVNSELCTSCHNK